MSIEIDPVSAVDWDAASRSIKIPHGLFVGGEERESVSSVRRAVPTPRDGSVLVDLAWADVADADAAVAEARRAFDHGPWPRMGARERGEVLMRFAALIEQHRDEIALLVSLEMGKPIRHGTVWVNCYEEGDMTVPFGGVKLSGNGRDKSRHALEEYTDLKTTWISHG